MASFSVNSRFNNFSRRGGDDDDDEDGKEKKIGGTARKGKRKDYGREKGICKNIRNGGEWETIERARLNEFGFI